MTRRSLAQSDVRHVANQLAEVWFRTQSVAGLCELLASRSDGKLYPNRVHSLLSHDPTRGVNEQTFQLVQTALAALPEDPRREHTAMRRAAYLEQVRSMGPSYRTVPQIADTLDIPPAVAALLLDELGVAPPEPIATRSGVARPDPEWSYQETAVRQCRAALRSGPNTKVGLIVPTGGGKTRIALRIALEELAEDDSNGRVVWVTHRKRLRTQVHRTIQQMLNESLGGRPERAPQLLAERLDVVMVGDLGKWFANEPQPSTILLIIDEAHHVAAPSYAPAFERSPQRSLLLTATPVRTDRLPIGIDTIGYTTTYRELFERGVLIEPEFLAPYTVDWSDNKSLEDLADLILDRAERDFVKTLIVVPTIEKVRRLHQTLQTRRAELSGHALALDDILYVHASKSSTGDSPEEFLDEFAGRPRGILVATTGLLAEGYDDPSINAVVVAYPTTSMIQLMQAGGRCVRHHPNKAKSFILQVRESTLPYRFEQRWLYQEISDLLRPKLVDYPYHTVHHLQELIDEALDSHNVPEDSREAIRAQLKTVAQGARVSLLFCGLPYSGNPKTFDTDARWETIFGTGDEGAKLVQVFNEFCARNTDIKDIDVFLGNCLQRDRRPGSQWVRFLNMLNAMQYARRELDGERYHCAENRPYRAEKGTTWLKYVTFHCRGLLPPELELFLNPCLNQKSLESLYLNGRKKWAGAVRLELPLGGWVGYLIDIEQVSELKAAQKNLTHLLQAAPFEQHYALVAGWRVQLNNTRLPLVIVERMELLIARESQERRILELSSTVTTE